MMFGAASGGPDRADVRLDCRPTRDDGGVGPQTDLWGIMGAEIAPGPTEPPEMLND